MDPTRIQLIISTQRLDLSQSGLPMSVTHDTEVSEL